MSVDETEACAIGSHSDGEVVVYAERSRWLSSPNKQGTFENAQGGPTYLAVKAMVMSDRKESGEVEVDGSGL